MDRGHRTGSSPSYTWTSASPGATASDTCKVTIFDVDITTPSSFPEYVCINGNLSLGSTVYPADTNSAGTFSWTKASGPGTVTFTSSTSEDPTFSANQAGTYTAKVEFTIDDSPGGCTQSPMTVSDTSGNIVVVGVSSISENKTEACVCEDITFTATANPSGQALNCIEWQKQYRTDSGSSWGSWGSASGGDPDAVLSISTAGQYQYRARNGTVGTWTLSSIVSVIEVDKVKIKNPSSTYDDVTGGTVVVLKGSGYTFKAYPSPSGVGWPSGEPRWSGVATGTGETIDVNFVSTGTYTLTAKCALACDGGKTVTIKVKEPTVYRVGFNGDHLLYETPSSYNGWGDGVDPDGKITDPVYDSEASDYNAVCVTKNSSSVSLWKVKLKVDEALTYNTDIVVDANGTKNWDESSAVTFSGTTSGEGTLDINGNIIDEVKKYDNDFQITWKYKVPSPSGNDTYYSINTTDHTMYVTYGPPSPGGTELTVSRIDWACGQADGADTPEEVADGIHNGLGNTDPPREPRECSPQTLSDDWWLLDGCPYYGWCNDQARLMERACEILGVSASTGYVYPSTDASCDTQETRTCPTHSPPDEELSGWTGFWNNFEAVCATAGKYYAVWPKIKGNTKVDVLRTWLASPNYQGWAYWDDSDPDPDNWHWENCETEPLP